jgi:antitoxin component YwqK of YwqJK toxin-antitoxin module
MHFEMNEAWILSNEKGEANQQWEGSSSAVQRHEEKYPDGRIKATWSSRTGANGDFVRHGAETWYYPNHKKKYEVTYRDGKKTGKESFWLPSGVLQWSWEHRPDGTGTWTHYWPNGRKKIESSWRGFKAEGVATHWDQQGKVIRTVTFKDGAVVG